MKIFKNWSLASIKLIYMKSKELSFLRNKKIYEKG